MSYRPPFLRPAPFRRAEQPRAWSDLETACVAKLDVDPAHVRQVIAEARKRLTLAAEYNSDELLGTALTRLNDLYGRCIRTQNEAKALDVQREINRLTGLYRPAALLAGDDSGGGESSEELAAVAEQLLPLKLAGESGAAYPLREHARLAAQRIAMLEAEAVEAGSD